MKCSEWAIVIVLCSSSVVRRPPDSLENESKSRSLGQILEKACVRSGGHIFCPVIKKLNQNVCLNEISDEFENGLSIIMVKN